MAGNFTCPHCLRSLTCDPHDSSCPTCGWRGPVDDDPRVARSRRGMRARRDDDDDYGDDYDAEDDDDFERPSKRGRRSKSGERPGKVQAIAIMILVGGIYAAVHALMWVGIDISTVFCGCLWPGQYY